MFSRFCDKLAGFSFWKGAGTAFLLGALAVLGLAPLYLWPAYIACFAIFLIVLFSRTDKKSLFWTGWFFGFGYFTFGLYWISFALHIDFARWWWLTPFALIGLPFFLSIYYGLAALALKRLAPDRLCMALGAIVSFSLAEYLRGILFTGFPWNLPAYIWVDGFWGQNLAWAGAYGLNVFVYAIAAFTALGFYKRRYFIPALSILVLLGGFGLSRLSPLPNMADNSGKTVMIVQPNIPQVEKWDRDKEWENFLKTVSLSGANEHSGADIVIWPETAITFHKDDIPYLAAHLDDFLHDGQLLLTGVTDIKNTGDTGMAFYNSLVAINQGGEVTYQYNKHHLVPFGEYIPFRNLISVGAIAQAISGTGDFSAGAGPESIAIQDGFSISPLICYEVIFPGQVMPKGARPDLLVNITNDGWYLRSSGPHQHLSMSRARAIETGIPLARAANTGISSLIDPYGRMQLYLPLQKDGTIISAIPSKLAPTLYSRFGHFIFTALVLLFTLPILVIRRAHDNS